MFKLQDQIIKKRKTLYLLFSLLFGFISFLAQAPYYYWPLFCISIAGFAYILEKTKYHTTPLIFASLCGVSYGFGMFFSGLFWIANAFKERGAEFAPWGIPAIILLSFGLSLFWGLGAGIYISQAKRLYYRPIMKTFFFGFIFFIIEYLRGHLFTGFPWGLAGYIWKGGGFVSQITSFIGIYGLTFITLAFGASLGLLFSSIKSKSDKKQSLSNQSIQTSSSSMPKNKLQKCSALMIYICSVSLFACPLVFSSLYGMLRLKNASNMEYQPNITIRLVGPQIDQSKKWKQDYYQYILNTYIQASTQKGFEQITHLIWPESALPILLLENKETLETLKKAFNKNITLITGTTRREYNTRTFKAKYYNSLVILEFTQNEVKLNYIYDKKHLVPFGEYIPFENILRKIGLDDWAVLGSLQKGENSNIGQINELPPFMTQICYEIIFPKSNLIKNYKLKDQEYSLRPEWIINISNDSWYGANIGPRQHENQVRYRALETGLPVLRAASSGFTGMVTPYGQSLGTSSKSEYTKTNIIDTKLPKAFKTFYTTPYAWLFFSLFLLILFLGIWIARI